MIFYGNRQRWSQEKFKSNLSVFFGGNGLFVVSGHIFANSYSVEALQQYAITIPGVLVGLVTGTALSTLFNPLVFRRVVLTILIAIGIRLLLLGIQA